MDQKTIDALTAEGIRQDQQTIADLRARIAELEAAAVAAQPIPDGLYVNGERHIEFKDTDHDLHRKAVHLRGLAATNALFALGWKYEGEQWAPPAAATAAQPPVQTFIENHVLVRRDQFEQFTNWQALGMPVATAAQPPSVRAAYARVREEFEIVAKAGHTACVPSAMLNVDALLRAALAAATAAQPDPETPFPGHWTNERCQYAVCDEAEEHDPKCTVWKEAAATAAPQVDEQRLHPVADALFDHLRITDKLPPLTRDEFREAAGSLIAAYIAAPDAPTDQERAAYWHRQWDVATGQLAECHAKLRTQEAAATAAQPAQERIADLQALGLDMLAALRAARGFIVNGTALGYIRMPDADCPDPAHNTLPMIEAAIARATTAPAAGATGAQGNG